MENRGTGNRRRTTINRNIADRCKHRVLEIYGGPFDDEREASVMHQQSGMNCGWAGPAYIGMLLHTDERSITEKYDEMMQYVYQISKGKSGSHIAGIAAVALADAIIDTWYLITENG